MRSFFFLFNSLLFKKLIFFSGKDPEGKFKVVRFYSFTKRKRLLKQRKNHKKSKSIEERLPKVKISIIRRAFTRWHLKILEDFTTICFKVKTGVCKYYQWAFSVIKDFTKFFFLIGSRPSFSQKLWKKRDLLGSS